MDKLKCITYNAKGLKDPIKRDGVFYWLKKKNVDLICIQEAHCEKETKNTWEKEWGSTIHASYGTGNSRGVCILTNKNSNIGTELISSDEEGRYVIIKATIGENTIKIAGYYGPNKDDPTTINKVLTIIEDIEADHTILMGDFNFTMNTEIDKKGGTTNNNTKCRNTTLHWMEDHDMCDTWRVRNPDKRIYTWRSNTKPPIFCRLDYFITSPGITNNCNICKIGPGIRSDHSYVQMDTSFNTPRRGRGFWKFDSTLLEDEDFKKELINKIELTNQDNPDTEPTLLWETIKSTIRGECISFNNKRRKKIDTTIKDLEKKMEETEEALEDNKINQQKAEEELSELKTQLERHVEIKGRWNANKNRNILYELGEKPNKYFLNQQKERGVNNVIRRLVKDSGEEVTNPKEILKEQQSFYEKIYTSKFNCQDEEEEDLQNIFQELTSIETPKIGNEIWDNLTTPITEEEVWKTIQSCADNKSPGTDGLNNNFYKIMWPNIKKYLLSSITATLSKGEMSISQKQGIISLIPKPNKDSSKLKNWRPITLLNQDYKYLAKCLANRCRKILPDIISPDQTGFVPNRLIGTNILKAQGIISQLKENQEEGILMGIDFEKAFDTIEWCYIIKALEHFNFPPILINWIRSLYNNISTCIINNGHTSQHFKPSRGVRQGCPLSPILFVISAELLAITVRNNQKIEGLTIAGKETKLSQFADDTTFYLKPENKNIEELFKVLEKFSKMTGLKINKEKTEILTLGNTSKTDLPKKLQQYVKESVKMLGVYICTDKNKTIQENYEPIIEKMNNTINRWKNKGLSIQGKIVIVKTLIVSKLIYALNVLPTPPKEKMKEIQDSLYKFIWDDKPDKVKRETLIADYIDGGLKMPDIASQNTSLKTIWIKQLTEKEGNWNHYIKEKLPFKDPAYFMECSITYADIPNKPEKDSFWNEVLINWCILNEEHTNKNNWRLEDIFQENIWWNSKIKVKKKVVEYKKWAAKGIKKIADLLNDEGKWLSHHEIQEQYKIKIPFTELYGIQKAITNSWGDITRRNITSTEENKDRLIDKLQVKRKGSQVIYWIIVNKKKIPPTTKRLKWERDVDEEITVTDWRKQLVRSRKLNENTRLQTWTYKYYMRLVPYNTRLKVMGKSETSSCGFCKKAEETLNHLYWECPIIQQLWQELGKIHNTHISKKLGLLGMHTKSYDSKTGLYVQAHLTRYFIHLCKCKGNTPTTKGLANHITYHKEQDLAIAKRNNNIRKFREKWGNPEKPQGC
jgi:exonuclease III